MGGALVAGIFAFLLGVGGIIALVFYLITLMRAMNVIPQSERPMPGGLVFLTFVPYLGAIWLIVFTFIVVVKLRKKTKELGLPGDGGLVITIIYYSLSLVGGIVLFALVFLQAMSAGFGMFGGGYDGGDPMSAFSSMFGAMGAVMGILVVFGLATLALFIVQWVQIAKSTTAIKQALPSAPITGPVAVE